MSTFLVRFFDVGRNKVCWEERITRPVSDQKILAAVKKKKALASKGVDIDSGGSDYTGYITAGSRAVGRFLIVPGSEIKS
jgi:hypothetical protein